MMRSPPTRLALLIWGLAASFYLFGFFQRITPASLAGDLMRDFKLTAAGLGNLSAFYYYTYAAMQIPTGMLVDRIGPSRLLIAGSALSGAGALLFATADGVAMAAAGRALIGAAHGIAFVSVLKLITHWFPASLFARMSGLSLGFGTLGAVLAGPPLRALADAFGWRIVVASTGAVALLLALAMLAVLIDDPLDRRFMTHAPPGAHARLARRAGTATHFLHDLIAIWRFRNTALLCAANAGTGGAFLAITGLWGVPFLVQAHGLTVQRAAMVTSSMLVVFALASPAFGALSDRWRQRKRPFLLGAAVVVSGLAVLSLSPAASLAVLVPALLCAAFGAGSMALSFAYAKESVPARLQGIATGAVNTGVILGTLIQMPMIGVILDAYWQGAIADGVRQYDLVAFQRGWIFVWLWAIVALLALFATREDSQARMP